MPVPDYQSLMLPALRALEDGEEVPVSGLRERIAASEGLTPEDVAEKTSSGAVRLAYRVNFALLGTERAGLVERVRRGVYRITAEGKRLLAQDPERIDVKVLWNYPSFAEWQEGVKRRKQTQGEIPPSDETRETPEEALNRAAAEYRAVLELEVLARVRSAAPEFLEQVVVDLLIAMGYGGGDPAMGRVTGRSGDGGIDGMIKEDALGLDEIYVQAKKYTEGSVGGADLRNFAGAIDAAGTNKGVFVTTVSFSSGARDYVAKSPKRIVLIDGEELARLMVQHNIGVRSWRGLEIKRMDEDYFEPESL